MNTCLALSFVLVAGAASVAAAAESTASPSSAKDPRWFNCALIAPHPANSTR